LADKLNNFSII